MTNAVARQNAKPSLATLINQMKPEIAKVLPNQMSPERMARIASTVVRQTPQLARCTPESFLGALLTASQLGLEPGPIGEAYMVPFNTKTGMVCQFIPGYRGLIKLARNSGQLVDIWAEVVYEADEFSVSYGLHRDLTHVPKLGDNRGEPIYVYAAAELKDGGRPFVVMTYAEVEAIRARSKASKNGPWVTDWVAMAKKTAVKQLSKWLPLSAEFNTATVMDGSVRTEVGALVDVQPDYVDGEVDTPAISASDDGPGRGDGNDLGDGAESSSGTVIANPPGDQAPPADVRMASGPQLAKLAQIRAAERYDTDSDWLGYLREALGIDVQSEAHLTQDQAKQIIDLFTEASAS